LRVSERLVIKPTWETYAAQPGDVVLELDPGMSFGTGRHGTTQACLEFLDQYSRGLEGQPLLDVGTGSGILAMAGHRLGLTPVMACDHDPQAVVIARDNLARAGLGAVTVTAAALEEWQPPVRGRIVVANILAPVLLEHAERLRGWLATTAPSYLLLSGILTEQYPAILERYLALGLRECARRTLDEWTSGCFVALEPTGPGGGF
ncbi:MAG: 50S ribosomal protein L11 methyltransferase, partial [bacterium]